MLEFVIVPVACVLAGLAVMLCAGAVFSWLYMSDLQNEIDDGRGLDPLCDERE